MEAREKCNIGLTLSIGMNEFAPRRKENKRPIQFLQLFTPCSKEEVDHKEHHFGLMGEKMNGKYIEYKNDSNSDDQNNNTISNNNDDDDNGPRKKLRLTNAQATLLEDSFKEHTTLNSAQKEYLAKKLNLKPRQVEVWFQNRRARTKVKQTEVDYEFLKKCCESLREENRRLRTELQELKSSKPGSSPLYVRYAKAATLTRCSSCNKIGKICEETNTTVIDMVGQSEKFYSGFDESALTC